MEPTDPSGPEATPTGTDGAELGPEDRARRRLLALAVYVPPAILGTLAVTMTGCQTVSCSPSQCQPAICSPADCSPGGCPPVVCNPSQGCNPHPA